MEKTINFRISEELKLELQMIALEKETKVSNLIREIISDFVENYYEIDDHIICNRDNIQVHEVILNVPANYNQ